MGESEWLGEGLESGGGWWRGNMERVKDDDGMVMDLGWFAFFLGSNQTKESGRREIAGTEGGSERRPKTRNTRCVECGQEPTVTKTAGATSVCEYM